jgi:hypothetical protein
LDSTWIPIGAQLKRSSRATGGKTTLA